MAEKPLSDALALSLYGALAPTLARRGELGKAVAAYQKLLTVDVGIDINAFGVVVPMTLDVGVAERGVVI